VEDRSSEKEQLLLELKSLKESAKADAERIKKKVSQFFLFRNIQFAYEWQGYGGPTASCG